MHDRWKAAGVGVIVLVLITGTYFYYRSVYSHAKRLRIVADGRVYRSGQLTADGFRDAVRRFGIRTIINVQDDVPDPLLSRSYLDRRTIHESELCSELGVRYVWLSPDLRCPDVAHPRPMVIDPFLALLDDETVYPVLIHCKAGLHRTGVLCAVYRMEYDGWSCQAAFRELKAHGFGEWVGTSANPYVDQYVLRYRTRSGKSQNSNLKSQTKLKSQIPIEPQTPGGDRAPGSEVESCDLRFVCDLEFEIWDFLRSRP